MTQKNTLNKTVDLVHQNKQLIKLPHIKMIKFPQLSATLQSPTKQNRIFKQDIFMIPQNNEIAIQLLGYFSMEAIRLFERKMKSQCDKLLYETQNIPFIQLLKQAKQNSVQEFRENFMTQVQNIAYIDEKFIDIKYELQRRGFLFTLNINDMNVNLRFCVRAIDINFQLLTQFQFANHIKSNNQLTVKSLLQKTLRNAEVDIDWQQFFPISFKVQPLQKTMIFDKNDESFEFLRQYTLLEAIKILRNCNELEFNIESFTYQVQCSFIILRAWLNPRLIDDFPIQSDYFDTCDKDFTQVVIINIPKDYPMTQFPSYYDKNLDLSINQIENQEIYLSRIIILPKDIIKREYTFLIANFQKNFQQSMLNDFNNIWICKPSGKSRGRGIFASDNLRQLLTLDCDQLEALPDEDLIDKDDKYIIQKYVERPLLIHGYKFDIRQWVLVSSVNPLVIWQWTRPYLRFCSAKYSNTDLNNPFIHLSNNSVQRHAESFGASIDGNMWHFSQMCEYLAGIYDFTSHPELLTSKYDSAKKFDSLGDRIMYDMARIVLATIHAARFRFGEQNGFEMFGYDFILDADLQVWCLEVNTSPTMEHSTDLVTALIKDMTMGYVSIICDGYCGKLLKAQQELFPHPENMMYYFPQGTSSFKLIWKDIKFVQESKLVTNIEVTCKQIILQDN